VVWVPVIANAKTWLLTGTPTKHSSLIWTVSNTPNKHDYLDPYVNLDLNSIFVCVDRINTINSGFLLYRILSVLCLNLDGGNTINMQLLTLIFNFKIQSFCIRSNI
jgi:hypothetical protein